MTGSWCIVLVFGQIWVLLTHPCCTPLMPARRYLSAAIKSMILPGKPKTTIGCRGGSSSRRYSGRWTVIQCGLSVWRVGTVRVRLDPVQSVLMTACTGPFKKSFGRAIRLLHHFGHFSAGHARWQAEMYPDWGRLPQHHS